MSFQVLVKDFTFLHVFINSESLISVLHIRNLVPIIFKGILVFLRSPGPDFLLVLVLVFFLPIPFHFATGASVQEWFTH
jgi:hypothetical protein